MMINSDSVVLHWTESRYDIDYYQIRYKSKPGKDKWKFVATDSKRNEVTICGLMANTTYVFQVRAVFEDEEGRYGPQSDDVITSKSLATTLFKSSSLAKEGNPLIYRLDAKELPKSRNFTAKTKKLEIGKLFFEQCKLHVLIRLKATLT